jgi:hypothetical protein
MANVCKQVEIWRSYICIWDVQLICIINMAWSATYFSRDIVPNCLHCPDISGDATFCSLSGHYPAEMFTRLSLYMDLKHLVELFTPKLLGYNAMHRTIPDTCPTFWSSCFVEGIHVSKISLLSSISKGKPRWYIVIIFIEPCFLLNI